MTSLLVTNENYVMTYCKKFFTENKSFIYLMDWCHTFLHTSWIHQIQSFKCLFFFPITMCFLNLMGAMIQLWVQHLQLQTENEGGFIPHFIKTPEPQQATLNLLIFEGI